jgi:HlyD family secretion protein
MMKKRGVGAKWVKWVVLVVVLAVLATLAWPTVQSMIGGSTRSTRTASTSGSSSSGLARTGGFSGNSGGNSGSSDTASAGSYSTVKKGNLEVTVYGSGSLEPAATKSVYNEAEGKVESIDVEAGDTVKSGDTLLKLSSTDLETQISTLQSDLFTAQVAMSEVRDTGSNTSVYAPCAGTIKLIDGVEEGDDISVIMKTIGYLCIISRDDKMKIEFEPLSGSYAVGDEVSVWIDDAEVKGVVDQVDGLGGRISVTVTDDDYDIGDAALVTTLQGEKIGEGVLEVNMPVPVTAIGGTIDTIYYDDNDSVSSGSKLFYVTGRIPSSELQQALYTYDEARTSLNNALTDQQNLTIKAPIDGVITAVNASVGQLLEEGSTAAVTMQSDSQFNVVASVDELDIPKIQAGQEVNVEIDAFPNQTFTGTVTKISGVGTVSGGVATYTVTVAVDAAKGLMDGMTASINIVTTDIKDALLVPVEAVSTSNSQNYVTLASGQTSNVTIGASNDEYVQILSGVEEGDQVLIKRDASSDSSTSTAQSGRMGGGEFSGFAGGMPGGGPGGF